MSTTDPRTPRNDPDATTAHLAAAVRVVSGLTLISRFAGLARDMLASRVFGDGALGSAFRAAYALPNLFRRLFGEGALSAAFLPEYTLLRRDDPGVADELATFVVRLTSLITGAATLALIVVLIVLLSALPDDADRSLSFRLMMLMLPMMPAVCLTAILGGMLQAHGRFGPPAAAPVILNIFQILAGSLFFAGVITDRAHTAYAVGAAAVVASAAQVAWSLWALRGRVRWRAAGDLARTHARAVHTRFLPAVIGLGTLQLNTMMDVFIAMWPVWIGPRMFGRPVPLDETSNAVLSNSQTIYQFPLGVFGIAVATAVFPLLSRTADNPDAFAGTLRRGLRLSFFIGLPASAGLVLVRHDLVNVIFGGGARNAFSPEGLARCADALQGFAPAVWAYSLNHVFTRAFYARKDTRTPMRVSMCMVALNLTLNLTLIWWLREAGLAWSTGICAFVQCLVLARLARTRLGTPPLGRETWIAFARIWLAAGLMGAAVASTLSAFPPAGSWSESLIRLSAGVGTGAVIYLALSKLFRLPELGWLLTRARRDGVAPPGSFE